MRIVLPCFVCTLNLFFFSNDFLCSEWLVRLPEGEDVTVVALGTQWVAAATTQSFVRLFRRSGLQDPPIMAPGRCAHRTTQKLQLTAQSLFRFLNFPLIELFVFPFDCCSPSVHDQCTTVGPVVTMAGKGSQLAIVYHRSAPSEDRQNLGFVVYNMEHKSVRTHTHRVVVRGDFPLRPNCTLDWLGFSQNPAAYGSAAGEQEETMLMAGLVGLLMVCPWLNMRFAALHWNLQRQRNCQYEDTHDARVFSVAVDSDGLVTGLLLNTMGWCGEWTPLLDTARDNTVKSKGSTHW